MSNLNLLIALGALNLFAVLHMWLQRPGSIGHKLYFSLILLVPVIGLIFYLAMYNSPESHTKGTEYPGAEDKDAGRW